MTRKAERKQKGRKMLATRKEKKGRGQRNDRDRKITREENIC